MLSKQCRPCHSCSSSVSKGATTCSLVVSTFTRQTQRSSAKQQHSSTDQEWHLAPEQQQQLRAAVVATAVCCAFVSNVGAARASDNWIPRRHHRHIGERFTDTWADSIVEVSRS
jgi:hypothetical protein